MKQTKMKQTIDAVLIVGPTGSGKTPLGEFFEQSGFLGRRCAHFDFGAKLRGAPKRAPLTTALNSEELDVIDRVLETGALLEDHQFCTAEKLLTSFVKQKELGHADLIVLNGLPRHVGQAAAMEKFVEVKELVHLDCRADVVHARIHLNSGGDRAGRVDDALEAVTQKLAIFRKRTKPLIDFYSAKGVPVEIVQIDVDTLPPAIADVLKHSRLH